MKKSKLQNMFDELDIKTGGTTYNAAKNSLVRYGLSQYKDSLRWSMMDICNKTGWYRHPYKFASVDARPWVVSARIEVKKDGKIEIKEEVGKKGPYQKIGTKQAGKFGAYETYMWEVDNKGRFIDDINMILLKGDDIDRINKDKPGEVTPKKYTLSKNPLTNKEEGIVRYRKVDPEDIYHGDELVHIADKVVHEWTFFKSDFYTGWLHPESRTWRDYEKAHDERNWSYRNLGRVAKPEKGANAAFDREALKDPGRFEYRGREFYYDEVPEKLITEEPINYYPCISVVGLTNYIVDLVKKTLTEEQQMRFFQLYPEFDFGKIKFRELGEEKTKKGE